MVLAVDRILDVENRRHVLGQPLAIRDGKAPVCILGHDLQRRAVLLRDLHADKGIAEVIGHRLDDARHARLEPGFLDVALFSQIEAQRGPGQLALARRTARDAPGKQKERGPVRAPTLKREPVMWGLYRPEALPVQGH